MWNVSLTLTEEHVPDAQHGDPGQGSGEGTHEPLRHVQDGVQLVLLQVAVSQRRHPLQQSKQDLSIQLDRLLQEHPGTTVRKESRLLPLLNLIVALSGPHCLVTRSLRVLCH